MPTLKEQLEEYVDLQHRQAVWEALYQFLDDTFVTKDAGREATKAIRVPGCAVEVVPQQTLEEILRDIGDGPIKELRSRIEEIENRQVVVVPGGPSNESKQPS